MSLFSIVQGRMPAPPPPAVALPPPPASIMPQQPMPAPGYMFGGDIGNVGDLGELPDLGHIRMDVANYGNAGPTYDTDDSPMGGLQELPMPEWRPRPVEGFEDGGFVSAWSTMPQDEYSSRPVEQYEGVNIPGYDFGGPWDSKGWTAPPVNGGAGGTGFSPVPPVSQSPTSDDSGYTGDAQIDGMIDNFILQGASPSQAKRMALGQAANTAELRNEKLADRAASLSAASASRGPDHFYEQLAAQQAKDANDRADMQRTADAQQKAMQQKAQQDWYSTQLQAQNARRQQMLSAGATAQNSFLSAARQADPNGSSIPFAPSLLYGAMQQNTAGHAQDDETAMPNIPGYIFNNTGQ